MVTFDLTLNIGNTYFLRFEGFGSIVKVSIRYSLTSFCCRKKTSLSSIYHYVIDYNIMYIYRVLLIFFLFYYREKGAATVNCDIIAHELYKPGLPLNRTLSENFGEEIITDAGEVDRKKLGKIVFSDKVTDICFI